MKIMRLESPEFRLAEIIWKNEPISSNELIKICEKELSWKKLKIDAELRRLYKRHIFQNKEGVVTSLISYEDYCARLSALDEKSQDAVIGFTEASSRRDRLWF